MFNMFNCHLFDENGWEHINILARIDKVAIVADPPFGGRLEPLAYSFKHLISAIEGKKMRVRKDVLGSYFEKYMSSNYIIDPLGGISIFYFFSSSDFTVFYGTSCEKKFSRFSHARFQGRIHKSSKI